MTAAACRKGRAALCMHKWFGQLLPEGVAGLLSPAGRERAPRNQPGEITGANSAGLLPAWYQRSS
jgi:hypothetical protein